MNDILFGNNNKAVIKKLANRSFRSNKMRNVIAVIAIALTTFLFTAVLTIGMGAKGTLEYNMAKMIGTGADALVQGLSEEQFQQLKENSMFEKVGCWVPIEIMTNTNRMVAEIDYADQPQLELRMQTPRTGSAPQKANEVLVSANILKDFICLKNITILIYFTDVLWRHESFADTCWCTQELMVVQFYRKVSVISCNHSTVVNSSSDFTHFFFDFVFVLHFFSSLESCQNFCFVLFLNLLYHTIPH